MDVVLESVVSELVKGLLKRLGSSEVRDFARQLFGGVDSELKELQNKLTLIGNLLRNMEDMQLSDDSVKNWFDNLQQWAYDAEDLLDELAYEALRHQASSSRGFSCLPACFPSRLFAFKMGSKVKEINSRLEQLCRKRSEELKLLELSGLPPTNVAAPQKPEETSSVPLGQVYGRNEDEVELLKMVKSGANFQLIAVVGVGGIGKTTIAREVYNHKELEDIKFEKKAWVCVSTTFDVLTISKKLLQQFSSSVPDNLNDVQVQLKEAVSGKKFLIVLDDIWKVEYVEWEKLKSPFAAGALGSTMIVTTRHTDVAQTIRCSHPYQLKLLSDEACKSLFKEHAFGTGAAANADQISISIYERVVKRCKGLPLAAKTLGCLLHSKPSNTWEEILESKIWSAFDESDHILPTLKLSYHYLPSNLKRCFGYCAIFPQDYEFEEKELALLWIAEGIVQPSNRQLDEAGECFHKLCSRSFFQQLSSDSSKYVMHDLVHDLAQLVFKGISFRFEQNIVELPEKVRYFTYEPDYYIGKNKFEALEKAKSLRTFLPVKPKSECYISATVIFDLLSKFEMLRALSFEGYQIIHLSDSVGDMIHLRYLNFSYTKIRSLPESTCQLFNLQTLLLKNCFDLMKLPSNMRYLTNLCHLDISGKNSLKEMPLGMKELKNLQILSNFVVGKDTGSNLEDLKSLSFLQGELHISELQNVTDQNQIQGQILSNNSNLKVLLLEWEYEENTLKVDVETNILDKLMPHSNLKELIVRGYGGERFPSWLGDRSWLSKLVILKLEKCKRCTSFPSLKMLSSLEDLTIKEMASLKRIDFRTPFKSLKFLYFENLEEWEHWDSWRENKDIENFPKLRELFIIGCPQLIGKVPNRLSSLEIFVINYCPKLVVSFSNFPVYCKLEIDDCKGIVCNDGSIDFNLLNSEYLANIPAVKDKLKKGSQKVDLLEIVYDEEIMESWRNLENTNFFSNINSLKIIDCKNLRSIGRDMLPLSLKSLQIEHCIELEFLEDLSVCSLLEYLKIYLCDSLECISLDGPLPETLNELDVMSCEALETLSSRRNEYLPKALTDISIFYCEELKSIAESFDNSTCLRQIQLYWCKNLESLPSGLHHLPCLQYMKISTCPKLSVREGVPTSLRQLLINECEDDKGMGMRMLTSPKYLHISSLPQLKSISDLTNLTALEWLGIISLPLLESISDLNNLNSLKELLITDLPQLKSISDLTNLTSLKELRIEILPQLESIPSLSGLTSLTELYIEKCQKLKSIPSLSGLTSLERLKIRDLPQLESFPSFSGLTPLQRLEINLLPQLESIPSLSGLTSLESLEIRDLPQLQSIASLSGLTSLESLEIRDLPQLESVPSLSSLISLESLEICDLPQLESIPSFSGLTSLERLNIANLPQLESIQDLSNLTSLIDFTISNCLRIKLIPSLSSHTSHEQLRIVDCPNLRSIPDLGNFKDLSVEKCSKLKSLQTLPSSLQSVRITDCPLLIKRWKNVRGKYSSKIAQIPKVVIDGKFIYNSKEYELVVPPGFLQFSQWH